MQHHIKAALAGDQSAWSLIHQHYYPALFARALQLCGSGTVAKDAVQDTFVTAFLKLHQLRNEETFGAWLNKILTHTCYRMQHAKRKHSSIELPEENSAYRTDNFNDKLDDFYTRNRLHAALADIPEVLRSTLLLRHFSHFGSYDDIASVLAVPVGTVRSRLNQAKVKLAEHWKKNEDVGSQQVIRGEEWNQFYLNHFATMHWQDDAKSRLLNHFDKNMEMVYTSGKAGNGRALIENEVHEDRKHGSWMEPLNAVTSGNISILEARNHNSAEYPDRCPPNAVFVLYRDGNKANRLQFNLR